MTGLLENPNLARDAGAAGLAAALEASREDTLATFTVVERSLEHLTIPQRETLNPSLWELGHVGWFQEFWITRNVQRCAGAAADPAAPRLIGVRAQADALYDSSQVPHATRWSLPLPDAAATRGDLASQIEGKLERLRDAGGDDASLYFFRLALLHEDMHHEAALYMAQSLGVAINDARWQAASLDGTGRQLEFGAGPWSLVAGRWAAADQALSSTTN